MYVLSEDISIHIYIYLYMYMYIYLYMYYMCGVYITIISILFPLVWATFIRQQLVKWKCLLGPLSLSLDKICLLRRRYLSTKVLLIS